MKKMFRSLRWRLIGALGLVILLTVLLSGALSLWTTTSRFDILVTGQSLQQAQVIAPLLEASYAYWGSWQGLDELLPVQSAVLTAPDDIFVPAWSSDVDWWDVVMDTLHIDAETLWSQWDELGSVADIAEHQGVAPETIIQAIIDAEQAAVDAAVDAGELSSAQATDVMTWISESASTFVQSDLSLSNRPWEETIADELGLPAEQVYTVFNNGESIAALAVQQNVAPEHLVQVIVKAEESMLRSNGPFSEQEIQSYLFQVKASAWNLIDPEFKYRPGFVFSAESANDGPDWTTEGINWLVSSILPGDQRLLIADREGWVVYDSAYERTGGLLPDEMLEQGVALWEHTHNDFIGTVIVAAGPGYYDERQTAFLQSVSRSLVVSGLAGGFVALLIGLAVSRQVIAPVTALTVAARQLADGNWNDHLSVRSEDELGQMSAAFNDMADQLKAQRQLRRRLVNDVAHELNTPLSIIQLEVEAMTDGLQSPADAAVTLRQEIDLLRNLVGDLEMLAETDAGHITLQVRPIEVNKVMQEAVARWQSRAQVRGVSLAVSPGEDLPLVLADVDRVQQVLANLLSNALRHTPAGGQITVSTALRQEAVLVQVRDTGEGIAAQDLPHIFERFYRVDRARSRHTGGRGLGLSIVKQIVTLHGGRVWVESTPAGSEGQGSVFGFTLPVAR